MTLAPGLRPHFMAARYLACDLGAESGRLMLGLLEEGRLTLEELHRAANTPVQRAVGLDWNLAQLFQDLKVGLKIAAARLRPIASISTDSWGVDYLFLDAKGELISPTFHYRDPRTAQGTAKVKKRVDGRTLFDETGIQFMPLNTIYQLAAESPERLAQAGQMLTIADGFNFFLSGVARIEESDRKSVV